MDPRSDMLGDEKNNSPPFGVQGDIVVTADTEASGCNILIENDAHSLEGATINKETNDDSTNDAAGCEHSSINLNSNPATWRCNHKGRRRWLH